MNLNHWWSERFQSLDSAIVALESGQDARAAARDLAQGAVESLWKHTDLNVTGTALTHFVNAVRAADKKHLDRFKNGVYGACAEFSG